MSTTGIESWASTGSYVHPVDLSAFISASPVPLSPPPPEHPPPYTEQLLEGHITLMSGAKTYKDEDATIDPVNSSYATSGDVSIMDRSITSTGPSNPEREDQPVATVIQGGPESEHVVPEYCYDGQYSYSVYMPMSRVAYEPVDLQVQSPPVVQCITTPATPPRPSFPPNSVRHNPGFDYPTTALPTSVQFHRPRHRSLSADNSSLTIFHQPVPDGVLPTAQSVAALPMTVVSPFPPRTTLPLAPISPESNIPPALRGGWVGNDPFVRRPSRLPPLQRPSQPQGKGRKRRGNSCRHGGNNPLPVSPITMTAVQE